MRWKNAFIGGVVLFVLLSFFMILAAVHVSSAEAKEKYITILSLADYTGPVSGVILPVDRGCADYFSYLNDSGGVNGVKVMFIGVDTRYDVARALSAYRRYRKAHKLVAIISHSTAMGLALEPLIEKDKIVQLTAPVGEFAARIGRTFATTGPPYQDMFGASVDWMVEDWKAKGKSGMPKVGQIAWNNPYGKEPLSGGKEYAQKLGIELLRSEFFPPGTLDHSVYLNRLARAGANYIFVGGCVDPTSSNIIRDAFKLGLTKNIQFVTDVWGPKQPIGVRAYPEALEGTVIVCPFLEGVEVQEHPLVVEIWKKYRKKPLDELTGPYGLGISFGLDAKMALEIALRDVGYEKLDGEAFYNAMQKITGNKREGITAPAAYSKTSRRGSREVKFYRVQAAKVVPITGWRKAPDTVSLHKW